MTMWKRIKITHRKYIPDSTALYFKDLRTMINAQEIHLITENLRPRMFESLH